jgi:hypothetical protein
MGWTFLETELGREFRHLDEPPPKILNDLATWGAFQMFQRELTKKGSQKCQSIAF